MILLALRGRQHIWHKKRTSSKKKKPAKELEYLLEEKILKRTNLGAI